VGREDPRLFWHGGELYVNFVGYNGRRSEWTTTILYAKINADLTPGPVHYPFLYSRWTWEKNWSFFSHGGELYAIYRVVPHTILRIKGDGAETVQEVAWQPGWDGAEMRGSAQPVLVGDEFWHFFHDRIVGPGRKLQYRTGLYTFEAKPPFRPRRIIREPLLEADPKTNLDNYAHVIFTGGAVRAGDDWVLASGEHDRHILLHKFRHADLEARLGRIG
jgi:predicted GH43/DUF377 family glycosyl hydrolase